MAKPRSNSTAYQVAAFQNAGVILEPPQHVTLTDKARPYYAAIVKNRPRETWNDADLTVAVQLATYQANIVDIEAQVEREGYTVTNGNRTVAHPLLAVRSQLNAQIVAGLRFLKCHSTATIGDSEKLVARNQVHKAHQFTGGSVTQYDPVPTKADGTPDWVAYRKAKNAAH